MIQLAPTPLESPRFSANQLGEYVFATEAGKKRILHDQKFGNINAAPYYSGAIGGLRRSFSGGYFSDSKLLAEAQALSTKTFETPRQGKKWANNARALKILATICDEIAPPPGDHRLVRRNAQLHIGGVTVSVLPDLVTENLQQGYIAFTKFRFSKSRVTADASEIVLLLLHHYGQRQNRPGLQFDFAISKIVDCFSETVISGHEIARHRDQQLHSALESIVWLWPQVEE